MKTIPNRISKSLLNPIGSSLPSVVKIIQILGSILLAGMLSGCGSYGPFFNCKTDCQDQSEYRDLFCVCQKKASSTIPGKPPVGGPYLSYRAYNDGNCIFQSERFIFNPLSQAVDVKIGYQVEDGTLLGRTEYAWHTVRPFATDYSTSYKLGFAYVGTKCFDVDYFISNWTIHKAGTLDLVAAKISLKDVNENSSYEALVSALDPISTAFFVDSQTKLTNIISSLAPQFETVKQLSAELPQIKRSVRVVSKRQCSILCQQGDPACLRNRPDVTKVIALRDKVLAVSGETLLKSQDLISIFGLSNDPCNRQDIQVNGLGIVRNVGEICSYPLVLANSDTTPLAAMGVGQNIEGIALKSTSDTQIVFNKYYAMPHLTFVSSVLNQEYGGRILSISADQRGVYFNTADGCVSMEIPQ